MSGHTNSGNFPTTRGAFQGNNAGGFDAFITRLNMLPRGTDRYGSTQSSLLVSNLDVTTRDNPLAAELAAADEFWRVERRQRRAPGGTNFLHNQSVYCAMKRASRR